MTGEFSGPPLLDLRGDGHLRITLSAPYGQHVADLDTSDYRDALFEVEAYPFRAQAETTFTGDEVEQLRDLVERFHRGEDLAFGDDQQFRLTLNRLPESNRILVAATLTSEGGQYPEIRFLVRDGAGHR